MLQRDFLGAEGVGVFEEVAVGSELMEDSKKVRSSSWAKTQGEATNNNSMNLCKAHLPKK
jgi:hypothetical protein